MPIQVSTAEKKAEIARDVVVAYLSHVKDEQLSDLDQISTAIQRLVTVVDTTFETTEKPTASGFGPSRETSSISVAWPCQSKGSSKG